MAMFRSRRLEGIFGTDLDKVTAAHVRSLVAGQVGEAFDLDFKGQLYGSSDKDKTSLAGDVAAMANTAGGVIVLGIAEDDQARAQAAPGVVISDDEAARIRQVVAAGVSPLPQFDVFLVPDEPASGRGFVLIEVPRSVLAPHAVLVNVSLRFPKRNGPTTRYLSEPEVAAEYRARLAGAAERSSRIEQVEADVLGQIDRHEAPWIVVSLLPDLPGDFVITKASFEAFEGALRSTAVPLDGGGISFHDFGVSHERVCATDSMRINMPAWGLATELYTDGTGVLAQRLYSVADTARTTAGRPYCPLSDEAIAAALVWSLQFLARHARDRAHTAGSATLRAVVLASSDTPLLALANDRRDLAAMVAMPVVSSVPPVTTFATIDDLADGPGLVASAARLHQAIGHALGVPELRQLTIDGEILGRGWGPTRRPHVEQWAAANGVEVLAVPVGA